MEPFTFCGIRSYPSGYSSPERETAVYQNHRHVVKKLGKRPHNNEGIHKKHHSQNSGSMNSLRALMETEENYLRTKYLLAETQTVARELKQKNVELERQIVSLLQQQHLPATTASTTTTTTIDETTASTTSSISSYCNGDLNTVNTNLSEEITRLYKLLRDREDKLNIRSSEVERLNVDLTAASAAYVKTEGDRLEILEKNRKAVKTLLKELMIRDQTIAEGRKQCKEMEKERSVTTETMDNLKRRIDVLSRENQRLKDGLNERHCGEGMKDCDGDKEAFVVSLLDDLYQGLNDLAVLQDKRREQKRQPAPNMTYSERRADFEETENNDDDDNRDSIISKLLTLEQKIRRRVINLIDDNDNDNSSPHDDGFAIVRINDDHPAAAAVSVISGQRRGSRSPMNQNKNILKDVNKGSINDKTAATTKTRKLAFHHRQHHDYAMIDKENACNSLGHGMLSSSTVTRQQEQQQRGFKRRFASSLFSSSSNSSNSNSSNSNKKPPHPQKRTASSLIKAVIPISRNKKKTFLCPNLPQNNENSNLTTIDGFSSTPSLSSSSLSLLLSSQNNKHNDDNIVTALSWHGMTATTNIAKKDGEGDDFSDATWANQNVFSDVDDVESMVGIGHDGYWHT